MPGFRFASVLFLAALPVLAQPCEAPPNVKTAIDAATLPPARPREERAAAPRQVRDQFQADYYAHRFYQEQYVANGLFAKPVQEEYKALLDAHADDLFYQMLYARTLKGTNTREAIALLDKILDKQPDYMLAHQKLTEIYSAPAFLDLQKLRNHLEGYWQGCPSLLTGYTLAGRIVDSDFLEFGASNFRKLLAGPTDNEAIGLYATLWWLEFKSAPLAGQAPVRERIRADVTRLRSLGFEGGPLLLNAPSQAYQDLGDKDGLKWVEEHMPKRPGGTTAGASPAADAINQWRREHPYKANEREAYQDGLVLQTAEWIKQWPDDPQARSERFMALRGLQDAPLEDTVQAAEDWIRVYVAHPAYMSPYMTVASFYSQHNMRYSELPDLLEKALADTLSLQVTTAPAAPVSDLYLPGSRTASAQANFARLTQTNSAVTIYIKIRNYDKAHEMLAKLGPALLEAMKSATEAERKQWGSSEYLYWNNMARLARLEGRKLDALEADRNAFFASSTFNSPNAEYMKTALRQQWKDVKGTEEGFEAWATKPGETALPAAPKPVSPAGATTVVGSAMGWTTLDKPLPDFKMEDAGGKTWQLADLKGKVTLINLWATWCGPCKAELPYLQKLFNKVRERKDLTVLTLNTDDNLGLILPFLEENKYTFPVLPASVYVNKLVPELSIPRNWIVDVNGVLKAERIGFGSGDDKWVDEMIAAMEKARGPAADR